MHRQTLALLLVAGSLAAGSAGATESDVPSITITRIHSTGTWLDPFGNKPDFFARIRLRDANGQIIDCGTSSTNANLLTARPNDVLCDPSMKVLRPYHVLVEVYDADGAGVPSAQSPADKADINDSAARKDAEIGPFFIGSPTQRSFTLSGPDADIDLTVSTTPFPTNFSLGPFVNPDKLDPDLGEALHLLGELDDPTPLSVEVLDRQTGTVLPTMSNVNIQSRFDLT